MARPLAPGIEVAIRREPRHGWRGIAVAVRWDANRARRFARLAGPKDRRRGLGAGRAGMAAGVIAQGGSYAPPLPHGFVGR